MENQRQSDVVRANIEKTYDTAQSKRRELRYWVDDCLVELPGSFSQLLLADNSGGNGSSASMSDKEPGWRSR
jgi:hypothetical protein